MRTELCDRLGIELPIFAFTHCRDVVAAVTNAGGFGVLGAVGFTPEDLEIELAAREHKMETSRRFAKLGRHTQEGPPPQVAGGR